jgi:LysR family transcriptional regulator, transcriptional activator of nhaA
MIAPRWPEKLPTSAGPEGLNYRHLYYFLTVARRGSIRAALDELGVAQATISMQLAAFEEALGEKLFDRVGGRLHLTQAGRLVRGYAEEIFGLGREMLNALRDGTELAPVTVIAGIDAALSRRLAARLLAPLVRPDDNPPARLACRTGPAPDLLGALGRGELDVVLTVRPLRLTGEPHLAAYRLG